MTFTAADHVTEREVGSRWEDCTFAAMLETLRMALPNGRAIPATITEVNRFRAATGLPDAHPGVTIEDTIPAAKSLYGLTDDQYTLTRDWPVLAAALGDPNVVCVVTGLMGAVPVAYRRWDDFIGPHAVANHGNLVFCDPLAPAGTDYTGDAMPYSVWQAFFAGLSGNGQALIMEATGGQGMIAAGGIVITSSKRARVITVGPLLKEPGGETVANAQIGYTYPCLGNVPGHRAVLVNTAKPYPDGVSRPTILFMASGLVVVEDTPVIPVVPGTIDTGPAVQRAWNLWVETHPT